MTDTGAPAGGVGIGGEQLSLRGPLLAFTARFQVTRSREPGLAQQTISFREKKNDPTDAGFGDFDAGGVVRAA